MKNDPPGWELHPLTEAQEAARAERIAAGHRARRTAIAASAVGLKPVAAWATPPAAFVRVRTTPAVSRAHRPLLAPAVPKVLSKPEQANAAAAYSKAHGVSIVQALKTLGFAS